MYESIYMYVCMYACKNASLYVVAQVPTAHDMSHRPSAGLVVGSHVCKGIMFRSNGRFVTSIPMTKCWFGVGRCRSLTTHGYYTFLHNPGYLKLSPLS